MKIISIYSYWSRLGQEEEWAQDVPVVTTSLSSVSLPEEPGIFICNRSCRACSAMDIEFSSASTDDHGSILEEDSDNTSMMIVVVVTLLLLLGVLITFFWGWSDCSIVRRVCFWFIKKSHRARLIKGTEEPHEYDFHRESRFRTTVEVVS